MRKNPKKSISKLAKEIVVSSISMRTIIKTDLQLYSYKLRKPRALTTLQKQKRLERAKILLRELKTGTSTTAVIFSDKKVFTIETKFNSYNDRVLAKCPHDIPDSPRIVYRCQNPSSFMVWAAVSDLKIAFDFWGSGHQDQHQSLH